MPQYGDMDGVGVQRQEGVADDGVLRNGIADLAARRAHLRAMAVARQAVEQRHMHPAGPARPVPAREHVVEQRAELARINAEHRTWPRDQGEDVPTRRTRRTRAGVWRANMLPSYSDGARRRYRLPASRWLYLADLS